jgi:HK97 gp10 family phage protein
MADTFAIKGLDDLHEKFKAITYDMKYKGGRFALRKAAQVVRDAAKQNAMRMDDPQTGRSIADNIIEKWNGRVYKATGDLGFRVGVQGGAKSEKSNPDLGPGGPTFHWRYLELGTEKQAAQPFLRPAMENNIDRVVTTFVAQYGKALDRAIAKAKK